MSKTTTIVTTTTALSAAADRIRADFPDPAQAPSKQRILNTLAREISGPKHDWGFLTGARSPVIQQGLPSAQRAALADLDCATSGAAGRRAPLLRGDRTRPALQVVAQDIPLYEPDVAACFASCLTGDLLAIGEDFTTEGTDEDAQCMFEPFAVRADAETGIVPRMLWGADIATIRQAGPAYFAASASEAVNARISDEIMGWDETWEYVGLNFKAFHMPHAILVMPAYPFHDLAELEESLENPHAASSAFRVFLDSRLDGAGRDMARAQVEDLLLRLAIYLGADPALRNIVVS